MQDPLALDLGWLAAVGLLSLRLAAVFLMTPLLTAASVPATFRVLLVLALAAALSLLLPGETLAHASRLVGGRGGIGGAATGALFGAAIVELAVGFTLSLGIQLAFAAVTLAGRLLGVQIGFGLAQVIDPATNASVPTIGSALDQLAVLVFFLVDGHHALLRGIAYSLQRFPLGTPWSLDGAFTPLLKQAAALFSLGFALAAPVVFCVLLADLALAVVGRNLPQMNVFALAIPTKVVVGLLALSLWVGGMGQVMTRVYATIYQSWDAIFADAANLPSPPAPPAGRLPHLERRAA